MTLEPEEQQTIFDRIKNAIASASDLTNFSENSPERAISEEGFAAEMRERQHEELAVQLSAYIEYAGKGTDDSEDRIDDEDLEDLGIDPENVDIDLLYEYMSADDLDELVKRNSVTRDPGSFADGQVTFETTSDSVVIEKGTQVATDPDDIGQSLIFTTDEEVSPDSGSTSVTAPITASERGAEYNVGAGTITKLPSAPTGVKSVTNNDGTSGGQNAETNAELRERAQRFLVRQAGGGTVAGVEGALVGEYDGLDLNDVIVEGFPNSDPQYFDVIVDGGPSDSELKDKIDTLEPVAVNGNLVRPSQVTVSVDVAVSGSSIDTSTVENDITDYLSSLEIGEDTIRDQLIATIITADSGITGIDSLVVTITGETHTYDTSASNHPLYKLDKGDSMAEDSAEEGDGIVAVTDASGDSYVEGTDYDEGTIDGSEPDAIDWGLSGANPDDGEEFYVDYDIEDDIPIGNREKAVADNISVTTS